MINTLDIYKYSKYIKEAMAIMRERESKGIDYDEVLEYTRYADTQHRHP